VQIMRVIAGSARGRSLLAPEGRDTRPITDRAKEGIFNMLGPIIELADCRVLDLFAGSGTFGIECLSRGAAHVTFVERNRAAASTIQRNLETLGFDRQGTVLTATVESVVRTASPVELAFCDPPYADDVWADLLPTIPAEVLVGHAEFDIPLSPEWQELRRRAYGRARIVIAERADG
jgi:16S rRNA (guanine966-N2)-methyltransferase